MTAVEWLSNNAPYCRHVWAGGLASEPLTTTSASDGLRATCTTQFTAAHADTNVTVATNTWTDKGAARIAANERRAVRQILEARMRRRRVRAPPEGARQLIAFGIDPSSMPVRLGVA